MTREVNQEGLALVRGFEGLRTKAYRCPAGVWTIGYGYAGDVRPGPHHGRRRRADAGGGPGRLRVSR
jgi:GH24 family phage-related lysozyme (muramidase)